MKRILILLMLLVLSPAGFAPGLGAEQTPGLLAGTLLTSDGTSIDSSDQQAMHSSAHYALENTRTDQATTWVNPDNHHSGAIAPVRTYQSTDGRYCREYIQTIIIGGQEYSGYGTACRQPDGTWIIVSTEQPDDYQQVVTKTYYHDRTYYPAGTYYYPYTPYSAHFFFSYNTRYNDHGHHKKIHHNRHFKSKAHHVSHASHIRVKRHSVGHNKAFYSGYRPGSGHHFRGKGYKSRGSGHDIRKKHGIRSRYGIHSEHGFRTGAGFRTNGHSLRGTLRSGGGHSLRSGSRSYNGGHSLRGGGRSFGGTRGGGSGFRGGGGRR